MDDFLSTEASSNIARRGDILLLNAEVLDKEDLEVLPRVVERLISMDGVRTAVVYGLMEETIYIVGKSAGRASLYSTMEKNFSSIGKVRKQSGFSLAMVPLGIVKLLDREKALSLVGEVMGGAFFSGQCAGGFSSTYPRLKEVKELVCTTAEKAI